MSINDKQPKRFINPFTDFGFKKIFGEEPNKDLLIDFVNQLLKEQNIAIKDLTYKKTEHLGKTDIDRKVVFDLYCENEKGEKFIVEMQKAKQTYFKDRTLYYSTFPIQEQGIRSSDWNYQLKAVFAIAVLDFRFNDRDKDKTIVNRVQLIDKASCKVFYDKLTFIFVQIPNFNKTIDELETRLDQWLYVLKNLDKFDRIPERIKDKIFQKVFNISEYQSLTEDERTAYEDSLKYYRDLKNSLDTAELDGYTKAEQLYTKQIEEERRQKDEERRQKEEALAKEKAALAKEKAALAKLYESARLMKKHGMPTDVIISATGLTAAEIDKIEI